MVRLASDHAAFYQDVLDGRVGGPPPPLLREVA
jgi:hypothetical protein